MKISFRILQGSLLAAILFSTAAFAAENKKTSQSIKKQTTAQYLKNVEKNNFDVEEIPPVNVTVAQLQKAIETSEKGRTPAQSSALTDAAMSEKMRSIRDSFLSVKNSDQLDLLLAKLDAEFKSLPDDAKFFAAQIIPARALRGLVYRMREVFETRSRAVHSAVLTTAKNTTTNFRIYLPTEHMKVVQEYFMSPYFENGEIVSSFQNEADIQTWLSGPFLQAIITAEKRIAALNLTDKPVVWDQRLTFGPDSFQDGLNRFRYIGELEKTLVRSAMMSAIASLNVLKAYNINEAIDLSKDLGSLYGIDGFLSRVDGVSADKISNQIRKHKLIGTILSSGKTSMGSALNATRWAITHARTAWNATSDSRKNESLYAIDTGYWRVNRQDIQANLDMTYRVIMSDTSEKLRSSVTGETIEINFAALFKSPPNDLKDFLPQKGDERETLTRPALVDDTGKTMDITYRNYAEGSPKTWKLAAYQPYFPSVQTHDDVFKSLRVLSHAGGNWLTLLK